MSKTTSMILGPKADSFIAKQVASGDYATASEVMRDALRRLERAKKRDEYEARIVDEALASGVSPRSFDEVVAEGRARIAARAAVASEDDK